MFASRTRLLGYGNESAGAFPERMLYELRGQSGGLILFLAKCNLLVQAFSRRAQLAFRYTNKEAPLWQQMKTIASKALI